jgi:hypothetical protein
MTLYLTHSSAMAGLYPATQTMSFRTSTHVISNEVRNLLFVNRESPQEARLRNGKRKSRFLGIRLGMTIYLTHSSAMAGLYPATQTMLFRTSTHVISNEVRNLLFSMSEVGLEVGSWRLEVGNGDPRSDVRSSSRYRNVTWLAGLQNCILLKKRASS